MNESKNIQLFNFSGFYNSIHSDFLQDEDFEELNDKINYKEFELEYSKQYVEFLNSEYWNELKKIWIDKIKFEHLYQPQYYNYWTDEIFINISFDKELLIKYINKNKKEITKYIEKYNNSYDWFNCYITNNIDSYIENCNDSNIISQVLQFFINSNNSEFELNAYYDINWIELIYAYIE